MLFSLIISFSLMFMFLKHPLMIGLTILIQTMLISLFSGLLNLYFWYSYILFLILIGGMMIIFIYMTSIASNEKFMFSNTLMLLVLTSLILMHLLQFFPLIISNFNDLNTRFIFFSLNKFMNSNLMSIFFLMITYLLITLIAVVNLTFSLNSPLRQTN